MGTKLSKSAYETAINQNIDWLNKQPKALEREHIKQIMEQSVDFYYPANVDLAIVSHRKKILSFDDWAKREGYVRMNHLDWIKENKLITIEDLISKYRKEENGTLNGG